MQPASAKWYDRRDYVFVKFCVEDSKDVNVDFEKSTLTLVVLEEVIILNIYIKLIFFTRLIQMILSMKEWTDQFYVVYKKGDSDDEQHGYGADGDSQDSEDASSGVRNFGKEKSPDFEKEKSLQDFVIERIPELITLKADAVFASVNPFFNLFVFLKASPRVDMDH
uniref:CS domain-containing protein n=1 Tax=Ailuropoda melanoleuca TaxID=9646 RepID=A0A7N5KCQ5_AILME